MIPFYAVILAGGVGSRMGGDMPKQFLPLGQKRVIDYALEAIAPVEGLLSLTVVCDPCYQHLLPSSEHLRFAQPGQRRQDSLSNALEGLPEEDLLVLIHDAARPFLESGMIHRVLEAARETGAAAAAKPISSTIKQADARGRVSQTLDRSSLWEIQTPQALPLSVLRQGLSRCLANDQTVTDDVALAEVMGLPVQLVEGSHRNLKLTTSGDLALAEFLLS